jgi:ABC-2 type transport system permease protein
VRQLLDHGDVQAVLRVNRGFAEDVEAGRTAPVQLLLDGTDSNTAGIVGSYAGRIIRQFSQELLDDRFKRQRGALRQPGRIEIQTRAWFNENLESRDYYVPGVISTIVTLMSLILTSMAVVREKEIGTMEQIMVTPMKPAEFILGKTIPFALICFLDVVLVSVVGVLWFGIPIRGNPLVLLLGVLLFLLTTLSIGLLISTVSQTQQQAMMTSFFFFMPAMLLSGFMFPIANMPEPVQWLTLLNPLRYFLVIIRGVFLKGVGLDVLWPQMLALLLLGSATLWFTARRFRKTLV